MTFSRLPYATVLLAARVAAAQAPAPAMPPLTTIPLAQLRDDHQLAAALQTITRDPDVIVADPAVRPAAQALLIEGVHQLQARVYDQALANFLAAYSALPSPRLLLVIAPTLRDMGRLADAANTYQRYLEDPAAGGDRTAEVKQLLARLDDQLTLLTVRVFPRGSEVSLDGGPFLPVGGTLVTRVRPGIHLVRVRKLDGATAQTTELSINGFAGEAKDVAPALLVTAPTSAPPPRGPAPADRVDGWLITGTQYAAAGPARRVLDADGRELAPIVPHDDAADRAEHAETAAHDDDHDISSGALAVLRIDGKGRGFAGGLGVAIARGRLETEVMVLKSDQLGGYVGLRYRILTGVLRPYAAAGVPGFVYDHDELQADMSTMTSQRLAVGLRAAAGLEVMITSHLSVQADVGYEHFFFIDDHYEADVFVPTVGVIGRL